MSLSLVYSIYSSQPTCICIAASLQYLHLWSNYISSTITGQLGKLSQLRELFLDDNELTGPIPPELGQLSSATYISLAENKISGVIPPSFGLLSSIGRLDLQFNNLFGEVPSQLASLPLGKNHHVQHAFLCVYSFLTYIEKIYIYDFTTTGMLKLEGNDFYGDIPVGICQNIQYLSGNCAETRRPTPSPASGPQSVGRDWAVQSVPSPSPTYEYWWSCNCCTTCYPGEE